MENGVGRKPNWKVGGEKCGKRLGFEESGSVKRPPCWNEVVDKPPGFVLSECFLFPGFLA